MIEAHWDSYTWLPIAALDSLQCGSIFSNGHVDDYAWPQDYIEAKS